MVIDAKQGISGAGRTFDETTHYSLAGENIVPYKVAAHRHTPEIEEQLAARRGGTRSGCSSRPTWCPRPGRDGQLLRDRRRGRSTARRSARLLSEAYADEPFVEVADAPPGVLEVRETNFCRLFAAHDGHTGKVLAFAAIDNLWKGTSSQALQNLNLMFGLPETRGLLVGGSADVFGSRWVDARPSTSASCPPTRGCPRASARRAWRPG